MKILIDFRWVRDKKPDGIGNFTINISRQLLSLFPDNEYIFLINRSDSPLHLDSYIKDFYKYSFEIPSGLNSLKNVFVLPKIINKIKPDVFFTPCFSFISFFIKNTFQVSVIHDLIPLIYPEMFKSAGFKFKLFYGNSFFKKWR